MFKLLIQLVFFFFLKVHLMSKYINFKLDFNKLQVKYKHFHDLQKHVQNQQHVNDVSFYEF